MSRITLLITLGILVLVSPFAGLPHSVLAWVLPILGGSVLSIGISLRAEARRREPVSIHEGNHSEHS